MGGLTADEAVAAGLGPAEGPLHAGLGGLGGPRLLGVHGVDGAARQRLGLGGGQLGGERSHGGGRRRSLLLGGQRQRLAVGGGQGEAARGRGRGRRGRLGLGEGSGVEARPLAVRRSVGALGFGGDGRGHLDGRLGGLGAETSARWGRSLERWIMRSVKDPQEMRNTETQQ